MSVISLEPEDELLLDPEIEKDINTRNKKIVKNLESKLNNQNFIKNAPVEVVDSAKNELKNIQKEIFEINIGHFSIHFIFEK